MATAKVLGRALAAAVGLVIPLVEPASTASASAVINVPADRPTIQQAIDVAQPGDTVLVAPGTYFEHLRYNGKAVRVVSRAGPQATILDGSGLLPVVVFGFNAPRQSELRGFTVQHGYACGNIGVLGGGGVNVPFQSSPTIAGNVIRDNLACYGGGGISSFFGSPLIENNIIERNREAPQHSGGGGGGIAINGDGAAELRGNVIRNNAWPNGDGGGVYMNAAGRPILTRNVIVANEAGYEGGGVAMDNQSEADINGNQILSNRAGEVGGGVFWLVPSGTRGPALVNNVLAGNVAPAAGSQVLANGYQHSTVVSRNIVVNPTTTAAVTCQGELPQFMGNVVVSPLAPRYVNCGAIV